MHYLKQKTYGINIKIKIIKNSEYESFKKIHLYNL